jgi:hypothetical protein
MALGMTVEEMIKAHRDEVVKQIEKERTEKMFELDKWTTGLNLFCKHLEEDKHITKIRYSYYNEPSIEYYDTDAPTFDRIWISVFKDRLYVRFMRQAEDENDGKPLFVIHSTVTVPMGFNGNFDIPTVYEFIKSYSAFKSKKVNDVEDKKQRIMEVIFNMSPKEVEEMLAKLNLKDAINSKTKEV